MNSSQPLASDERFLRRYLKEVGRHRLLTKQQEVELAQQIELGVGAAAELAAGPVRPELRRQLRANAAAGEAATQRFIEANLRLVVAIAKRYRGSGLPLLDLIQEGNLGLIHAVAKFDWRRGFKFSTYATWWIRQSISRGIANTGRTIRLPVHTADLVVRIQHVQIELQRELNRAPLRAELAARLEVTEARVNEALLCAADTLSLSTPVHHEGEAAIGDLVEDRDAVSPATAATDGLLAGEVARLLNILSDRERAVIELRFGLDRGEPRTLEEVGRHFNLTRERIRQLEATALSKLRHPANGRRALELLPD